MQYSTFGKVEFTFKGVRYIAYRTWHTDTDYSIVVSSLNPKVTASKAVELYATALLG